MYFDYFAENNNFHAPALINFRNFSQHIPDFNWSFGDDTYSTGFNPSKKYLNPGIYTVTLTGSCSDYEKTQISNIEIYGPPIGLNINNFRVNLNNSNHSGELLYLEIRYNGNYVGSTKAYTVNSFPFTFTFPGDLFSGSNNIHGLTYTGNSSIRINVWDLNANRVIHYFYFYTSWWQNNYYPAEITWEGDTKLFLSYY